MSNSIVYTDDNDTTRCFVFHLFYEKMIMTQWEENNFHSVVLAPLDRRDFLIREECRP